jgi:shikimate 5-dehydrogenase
MIAAKERKLRVLGGRAMIDHQLANQIEFWRGDHFALAHRD